MVGRNLPLTRSSAQLPRSQPRPPPLSLAQESGPFGQQIAVCTPGPLAPSPPTPHTAEPEWLGKTRLPSSSFRKAAGVRLGAS